MEEVLEYQNAKYGRIVRTPESRFASLPDFDYQPHYINFRGIRMHYLDVNNNNKKTQQTFFCLHGEPTWCYLYRKMIPVFVEKGFRVIAPDFIGFGKSDKIEDDKHYNFNLHRDSIMWLIEQLDLSNLMLVCQDWGGIIGLTIPMDMQPRFCGLLIMNTALGTGNQRNLTPGFLAWRAYVGRSPELNIAKLMKRSCPQLTEAECNAYAAPHPNIKYYGGVRSFPPLVPENRDSDGAQLSRRAGRWWKNEWSGKTFMAIGCKDIILTPETMMLLKNVIRSCPEPMMVSEAGHFVQEWGEEVARKAMEYFLEKPKSKY